MDIYTQENGLSFEINRSNFTAKVTSSPQAKGSIQIPRFINFISQNFLVTSIGKCSFKSNSDIESISFPEDSQLLTIDEEAFDESSLNCLFIPSSVQELKESWCKRTKQLINISISPQNALFSYVDSNFIVTVSDKLTQNYDTIVFARRDIETVTIPSNIKRIASDSFSYCQSLKSVKFSLNSEIASIGKSAFSYSSIESLSIPSNVINIDIEESAFSYCKCLKTVDFPNNIKLDLIDQNLFASTAIQSITIPSSVTIISKFAFYGCNSLKKVDFQENSELFFIDKSAFADSSLEHISIPSSLNEIGECVFYCCNIKKIEFPRDSDLEIIGSSAFSFTVIEAIHFPAKLKELSESAFDSCQNLVAVEFASERLSIGELCFNECENLIIVSFPNSTEISVDESSFSDVSPDFTLYIKNFAQVKIISP